MKITFTRYELPFVPRTAPFAAPEIKKLILEILEDVKRTIDGPVFDGTVFVEQDYNRVELEDDFYWTDEDGDDFFVGSFLMKINVRGSRNDEGALGFVIDTATNVKLSAASMTLVTLQAFNNYASQIRDAVNDALRKRYKSGNV